MVIEYKGKTTIGKKSEAYKEWIQEDKIKKDTYIFKIDMSPDKNIYINARNTQ